MTYKTIKYRIEIDQSGLKTKYRAQWFNGERWGYIRFDEKQNKVIQCKTKSFYDDREDARKVCQIHKEYQFKEVPEKTTYQYL